MNATFDPIWSYDVEQGLQTFLSKGHISYYTTVRGLNILCNWFFRDMLHSTKSINFLEIYYFFIIHKMCLPARWNGFAGRIWPRAVVWRPTVEMARASTFAAGPTRSLQETPQLVYVKLQLIFWPGPARHP